jgi:hypothetical protein
MTLMISGEYPAKAPLVATGARPHNAAASTASAIPEPIECRDTDDINVIEVVAKLSRVDDVRPSP